MSQERNSKKELTQSDSTNSILTEYDVCDLYIRCIEVFIESCSRNDLEQKRCFDLGQVLWEKTIEARDEYRKSYPVSRET